MVLDPQILLKLAHNISLFALVVLAYANIRRHLGHFGKVFEGLALGCIFGSTAVLSMIVPINFAPGVFFDGRTITVGLAALFGGPLAGGTALAIAGIYRYWIGGMGWGVGLTSLTFCWEPASSSACGSTGSDCGLARCSCSAFFPASWCRS